MPAETITKHIRPKGLLYRACLNDGRQKNPAFRFHVSTVVAFEEDPQIIQRSSTKLTAAPPSLPCSPNGRYNPCKTFASSGIYFMKPMPTPARLASMHQEAGLLLRNFNYVAIMGIYST